jgi:hypothetical protein
MSESPLFKRAFVRGLNAELIRQGVALYPTKEAADYAADFVADNTGMPDPVGQPDYLTTKVAAELCDGLIKASQHLCAEAGNKYSPSVTKTAQVSSPEDVANAEAFALMQKAAAETSSLYEGGDAPNDMPAAASSNAEAAQEQNRRPENYSNLGEDGVGGYERKGQGSVGTEEKHPEAPKATEAGSNSVTENSKVGSLAAIIRKIAADDGQLMDPGQMPNDLPAAAQANAEAAQEMNRRPENTYNMGEAGVGQTDMPVPGGAQVGMEMVHPEAPAATEGGSNSVIAASKSAAFQTLFKAAAAELVPYLPAKMSENQKVAHVRAMMGLEPEHRSAYLFDLYSTLGATKEASASVRDHYLKTASLKQAEETCDSEGDKPEMPPAMASEKSEKKEEKSEKQEFPFEMKSEKKEASLSALRRAISNLNA